MQLTSIQPAISSGGGAVTRSTTSPGAVSGAVPQPATSRNASPAPSSPVSASRASPVPAPSRADGNDGGGVQVVISQQARESNPGSGDRNGAPERGGEGGQRERQDRGQGSEEASPEQQVAVQELRSRDQEVRQHEQAHQSVGGQYAGAATYTYQRGPNGQLYAVGGQVSIDTSPIPDDPEATISKMQTVRSAALAPAEPSAQDIQVAQQATSQLLQAQAELRAERRESTGGGPDSDDPMSGKSQRASGEQDDARLNLFRAVDGFISADGGQSSDARAGFRATA